MHSLRRPPLLFLLLSALSLAACGGGSSSGSNTNGSGDEAAENRPPVAKISGPVSAIEGERVTLDASSSTDPDGDTLSYSWFGSGGGNPVEDASNNGESTYSFTVPVSPGGAIMQITVEVDDGEYYVREEINIEVSDITPPKLMVSTTPTGINDGIVIESDEPLNMDTLEVEGSLILEMPTIHDDSSTWIGLIPAELAGWPAGVQTLRVSAEDTAGNRSEVLAAEFELLFQFSRPSPALSVIGQMTMDNGELQGGGGPSAYTLNNPYSAFHDMESGTTFLADTFVHRLLLITEVLNWPSNNPAQYVIGQEDFSSGTVNSGNPGSPTNASFSSPSNLHVEDGQLVVTDSSNNRVMIFVEVPRDDTATADVIVGQSGASTYVSGCGANQLNNPRDAFVTPAGQLLVADTSNNRVLVWNNVPTTNGVAADLALGQQALDTCASNDGNGDGLPDDSGTGTPAANTLQNPRSIWSDGTRVAVVDSYNRRVLIWNEFPDSNGEPADVVLGQSDFSHNMFNDDNQDGIADSNPTARTLNVYYGGVWSNGLQLFVADGSNNRVLVWDEFPTTNFESADQVIGQVDFVSSLANDTDFDGVSDSNPNEYTLHQPVNVAPYHDHNMNGILVTDRLNHRVLVFPSN